MAHGNKLSEETKRLLKVVTDHFDGEDRAVRERQIRTWRELKLLWDNFSRIWYSEVAHDWRIYDREQDQQDADYYDKPINIFKAYLESIIAALSVTVPPIKCFPDDADNNLDLSTAKAGDKIAQLIYRHNDAPLLWLHALFIYCTEGLIAAYTYAKEDEAYGTYKEKKYEESEELRYVCQNCNTPLEDDVFTDQIRSEFQPTEDPELLDIVFNDNEVICPTCAQLIDPNLQKQPFIVTRLVGETTKAKSRQCIEIFGGLFVKVPNYAQKQEDCLYLILSREIHYASVLGKYPWMKDKIKGGSSQASEYEAWARISTQYRGDFPENVVTERSVWLRPESFNVCQTDEEINHLKRKYPKGVKVVFANDLIAEACPEAMDDCWTLSYNPLSDYLHHEPLGMCLTAIQDITNDIISLTLQTMEHGIPQTWADPGVVNFEQYKQLRATPGSIIPTKTITGKSIRDAFHEVKTATLSPEVLPFAGKIQELGQLTSGALPSLFGGQMEDNKTASGYSMARSQALQRLQTSWKLLTFWWKNVFSKVVPAYIKTVTEDERDVEQDEAGNFVNVFIRRAELEGKIGKVELEANENLPLTWSQIKDTVMQLLTMNNPEILQALTAPENLKFIREAVGLVGFVMPGEADVAKQSDEIRLLLNSAPLQEPAVDPATGIPIPDATGMQPAMNEVPSVEIDPDVDNHEVEADICRRWLISEAGRVSKIDNPNGYKNVLLHMKAHTQHMQMMQQQAMMAQASAQGNVPPEKPKPDNAAPKVGEINIHAAN